MCQCQDDVKYALTSFVTTTSCKKTSPNRAHYRLLRIPTLGLYPLEVKHATNIITNLGCRVYADHKVEEQRMYYTYYFRVGRILHFILLGLRSPCLRSIHIVGIRCL
jgi:hypothetical protein